MRTMAEFVVGLLVIAVIVAPGIAVGYFTFDSINSNNVLEWRIEAIIFISTVVGLVGSAIVCRIFIAISDVFEFLFGDKSTQKEECDYHCNCCSKRSQEPKAERVTA